MREVVIQVNRIKTELMAHLASMWESNPSNDRVPEHTAPERQGAQTNHRNQQEEEMAGKGTGIHAVE